MALKDERRVIQVLQSDQQVCGKEELRKHRRVLLIVRTSKDHISVCPDSELRSRLGYHGRWTEISLRTLSREFDHEGLEEEEAGFGAASIIWQRWNFPSEVK